MTYVVTGGTGFIGRHLVEQLLSNRAGTIFVVVPESSLPRFDRFHRRRWSSSDRVQPVVGDLGAPSLGVAPEWVTKRRGSVSHFFHVAAVYDIAATPERNDAAVVAGTRAAVDLAVALEAGAFEHVSSVAVAGDYRGGFDETMFDVGQQLPSPYHQQTHEAERIVRDECTVPWRIYRPATVVGHSETGVIDKIDGPYYFFPTLKRLRDSLPQWVPLFGVDLGDTNVVPVDFVAKAMDHLSHAARLDGHTFHLVDPVPQSTLDVVNTLAAAAKAPQLIVPVDRRVTAALPSSLEPVNLLTSVLRTAAAQRALAETVGRLGVPPEVLDQLVLPATFSGRATERELSGSDITCPPLETYAATLWDYWEQHLDPSTAADVDLREALHNRTVVVTDASSEVGTAIALKVAQAGGTPLLVAPAEDGVPDAQAAIEDGGGSAHSYPCDLGDIDAIDDLTEQVIAKHHTVDFVVNNAGDSIRRKLALPDDGFRDFQRAMQLSYFGPVRLVLGLLPSLRESGSGHVINVSSIGAQTAPPRFSAYLVSKAVLDAWSGVVSSDLLGDGIRVTTIDLPLVRTPSSAPAGIDDASAVTPAQAANLVMAAIKDEPPKLKTALGTAGEAVRALLPKTALRLLDMAQRPLLHRS